MSELELLPLNHPMMKVPPDEFDFEKEDAKELADLIWKRQRELGGAGLSANQVGRNAKMFTMGVDRGEDYNYKRVLFNPGTENHRFNKLLDEKNIYWENACSLALLSTNQY